MRVRLLPIAKARGFRRTCFDEGDANHVYRLDNNQNKTHFVLSIGGDVQLQKGSHGRDVSATLMLRKVW